MNALPEFSDRHAFGAVFEINLKLRLEQRGWNVQWEAAERRYPPETVAVLNQARVILCGPDLIATRAPIGAWAIDAKTALPRRDGQQHIPGLGRFNINAKALRTAEGYAGLHRMPVLFGLDDTPAMFVTAREVRNNGHLSHDQQYWTICADIGRSISYYFGDLPPGAVEASWEGEWPGDFPLRAA